MSNVLFDHNELVFVGYLEPQELSVGRAFGSGDILAVLDVIFQLKRKASVRSLSARLSNQGTYFLGISRLRGQS